MIFAFTGTRRGMTWKQQDMFSAVIFARGNLQKDLFIHGGCIGADAQAHDIVRSLLWPDHNIEVYQSNIPETRAKLTGFPCTHPQKPPLIRNEIMMERGEIIIATPKGMIEERRSGTWHAIRCARRLQRRPFKPRKKIILIFPDGTVEED